VFRELEPGKKRAVLIVILFVELLAAPFLLTADETSMIVIIMFGYDGQEKIVHFLYICFENL
jgi:hypothetical protein